MMLRMSRHLVLGASLSFALCATVAAPAANPYPNTASFGVPFSKDEPWYRQCMRVAQTPAPRVQPPSQSASRLDTAPAARAGAPRCDAYDLYYTKRSQATVSQAEWNTVRQCALDTGSDAILMMLYANGLGVQRDTGIAIHHACRMDAAKAEMAGRVEHLAELRAGAPFDQCDDVTSGRMGSECAAIRETQALRVRQARLDRMATSLAPAGRTAFARLRTVLERYVNAGSGEVDMQGTGAAGFATAHEGRLREQFMQAALDLADGKLAPASPADFARRDRELNDIYRTVMAIPSKQADQPDRIGDSTVTRADVRAAERAWLAYRDAFVAFAATLAPRAGAEARASALKTLLTRQRIAQLNQLARYR